ncbi:hypothetical protein LCGC14_0144880 [marine sediment metagenome]|uniref:Uncharacterized protein n=1 Tax=marine sediment metagenome TaxID=412755 RepID=A0A0F9XH67_9ZZZZ
MPGAFCQILKDCSTDGEIWCKSLNCHSCDHLDEFINEVLVGLAMGEVRGNFFWLCDYCLRETKRRDKLYLGVFETGECDHCNLPHIILNGVILLGDK